MFQRDMVHSPIPILGSKHHSIVTKMDAVIANTFQSIRQLRTMIKTRGADDEISAEALMKLLRASWAVENSQDSGRQLVANRDKASYKTFINTMKRITSHVEMITKKCNQHATIPFDLTTEASLFGGDIMVLTQKYTT